MNYYDFNPIRDQYKQLLDRCPNEQVIPVRYFIDPDCEQVYSSNDQPIGFRFNKLQEKAKKPSSISHNVGRSKALFYEYTFPVIKQAEPDTVLLQEFLFDEESIKCLQEEGYNILVFPYIFGMYVNSCLVIAYSDRTTQPYQTLLLHRNTSFPAVKQMLEKRFDIQDIVAITPTVHTGNRIVSTFHNSSFANYKDRVEFMEQIIDYLHSTQMNFICAGDANSYGPLINSKPRYSDTYLNRQLGIAIPYYIEAFNRYGLISLNDQQHSHTNELEKNIVKNLAYERELDCKFVESFTLVFKDRLPRILQWIFWFIPNYHLSLYLDCVISRKPIDDISSISNEKDHDVVIF